MTQSELNDYIEDHELWLKSGGESGAMLHIENRSLQGLTFFGHDLRWAQFSNCDMSSCNFTTVNLKDAEFINCILDNSKFVAANLEWASMEKCSVKNVNFTEANIFCMDMRFSDFTGSTFEFSVLPLWSGGTYFKVDNNFVALVLAHLCTLDVPPEAHAELDKVIDFVSRITLASMQSNKEKSHDAI